MENKQTIQLQKTRIRQVLRLAEKLRAYRWRMAGAVLSGIGHQLSIVAVSVLGAYLVGLAVEGRLLVQLPRLLVFFILWIALRVTFYFLEMWLSHDVAFKVLADFRVRLFEAIERISPAVLLNMRSGQLASTLMSDVELLEWFFAHSFGSILVAVIVPLILLFCLGSLSPLFPLLMLVFLAAILWIPFMMKEKADRQGALVREQLGEANAVTIEGVQGLKEILSLNFRKPYLKKNEAYMSRLYDSQLAYGKRLGTEGALLQAALGGSMLCVAAAAALLTAKGQLEVSLYPVAVVLAGMTLNPVVEICSTARNFGLIFGAADRVYRVLESRPQVEDTGAEIRAAVLSPRITFENITFRYRPELAPAVQKLSFTVEPGETVALVGHSGAGKSTCVQLLLRHWDPQEGRICIGGRDLREMKLANLHQMISVVLQDVYLFRETIRENIRLGRWTLLMRKWKRRPGWHWPMTLSGNCPRAMIPWPGRLEPSSPEARGSALLLPEPC